MPSIRIVLMTADVPNKNGRVYPLEMLKKAVVTWEGKRVPIINRKPRDPVDAVPVETEIQDIVGIAKLKLEDDRLVSELILGDTTFGKLSVCAATGIFSMSGIGRVNAENVVTDYELESINLDLETVVRHNRLRETLRNKFKTHATRRPEENR